MSVKKSVHVQSISAVRWLVAGAPGVIFSHGHGRDMLAGFPASKNAGVGKPAPHIKGPPNGRALWTNRPTDQRTNRPTGQQTNRPTDQQTNRPTGQQTNRPADQQTNRPADQQTNRPADQQTNRPTDQQASRPTDQQANRPTGQQTNRPTDQQTNRPTDQQTSRPADQQTNRPTDQQTNRPADQQTNRPTDQQTNRPTDQQTNRPTLPVLLISSDRLTRVTGAVRSRRHSVIANLVTTGALSKTKTLRKGITTGLQSEPYLRLTEPISDQRSASMKGLGFVIPYRREAR
ncbi:hypothetical protein EGW08_000152 [Elysia chlorotica]|uniref:Uncharacterized protein n=1 Tax=Elysia chlorotica TaxID=188477 RepID=A0A433UEB9_ELYCH|nr:hypothetical protein EGW08_000152 [Elysia chlorotica]